MVEVNGEKCPICGEKFSAGDDVVFCPDCGTPHHRECYRKIGHCANLEKHKDGFTFRPEPKPRQNQEKASAGGAGQNGQEQSVICPHCGLVNPKDGMFCQSCGSPLHGNQASAQPNMGAGPMPNMGPAMSMFGDVLNPNEEFEEIPAKDWAKYIGNGAAYYLSCFKRRKDRGNKGIWPIFSAVLFGPFYFLYRKMWAIGAILLVASFLLLLPFSLLLFAELANSFQIMLFSEEVLLFLNRANFVCTIVEPVLRILCALFAVNWYQSTAAKQIKKLRSAAPDEATYQKELEKHSGPSKAVMYIGIGLMLLYSFSSMWMLF